MHMNWSSSLFFFLLICLGSILLLVWPQEFRRGREPLPATEFWRLCLLGDSHSLAVSFSPVPECWKLLIFVSQLLEYSEDIFQWIKWILLPSPMRSWIGSYRSFQESHHSFIHSTKIYIYVFVYVYIYIYLELTSGHCSMCWGFDSKQRETAYLF